MNAVMDSDVDMLLREYDDKHLRCRTYGHAWQDGETDETPFFGVYLVIDCLRCRMQRRDIVDLTGKVASRSYSKVEGYRLPGVGRQEFRAELVKRQQAKVKAKRKRGRR